MNDLIPQSRTPKHLWIIGGLSLLWNLMGGMDFILSQLQTESYMALMSPSEAAYFSQMPAYVNIVWAFGVFGSILGSLLLLLRHRWAVYALRLSLLGIFVNLFHGFVLAKIKMNDVVGTAEVVFSAVIVIVAAALLFYATRMRARGVLH
ncbi:MAG: hypothetical protein O3A08_15615 [Proteobacteria bacterium]|nr:hypothetical protein [Pseudomonadota bacterium]